MTPILVLSGIVLFPVLLAILLRANGVMLFLSVCLGLVLATYVTRDMVSVITAGGTGNQLQVQQWAELTLLVFPVITVAILTRRRTGGLKIVFSVLSAVIAGAVLALFAVPYLSRQLQQDIQATFLWHQLDNLQTALLIAGTILVFVYLATARKPSGESKKKKHGK